MEKKIIYPSYRVVLDRAVVVLGQIYFYTI